GSARARTAAAASASSSPGPSDAARKKRGRPPRRPRPSHRRRDLPDGGGGEDDAGVLHELPRREPAGPRVRPGAVRDPRRPPQRPDVAGRGDRNRERGGLMYTEAEMLAEGRVQGAVGRIRALAPRFDVYPKKTFWLHRAIGALFGLLGNPDYLEHFWTTIRYRAGFPGTKPPYRDHDWRDAWHEGRHAVYATRLTPALVWLLYSFPQNLVAPFAFLAGFHDWRWLFFAAAAIAPLPSPFRLWLELRCYSVQLVLAQALGEWNGLSVNETLGTPLCLQIVDFLSGPAYYWACPSRRLVQWLLAREVRRIGVDRDLDQYEQLAALQALRVKDG